MSTVLMPRSERAPVAKTGGRPVPWTFVLGSGLVLGLIGWVDVLLLWYPARFGDAEWEFGTISSMFDALPLATIGLVAVAIAVSMAGGSVSRKITAVFALFAAVAFLVLYVLFALSFLQGWQNIPPQASWILIRAGVKATLFAFAYAGLYGWIAFMLLRSPISQGSK